MIFSKPDEPALFEFEKHHRGWLTYVVVILIVAAIAMAFEEAEARLPLFVITPVAALLLWWISSRRTCGMKITEEAVVFHAGRSKKRLMRPLIQWVEIQTYDEGTHVQFRMLGGALIDLPPHCQPEIPALKAALQENGFAVTMR
ncbi:MAG: hypothetical protein AAF764_01360 [Pseudomonadota bacterium]